MWYSWRVVVAAVARAGSCMYCMCVLTQPTNHTTQSQQHPKCFMLVSIVVTAHWWVSKSDTCLIDPSHHSVRRMTGVIADNCPSSLSPKLTSFHEECFDRLAAVITVIYMIENTGASTYHPSWQISVWEMHLFLWFLSPTQGPFKVCGSGGDIGVRGLWSCHCHATANAHNAETGSSSGLWSCSCLATIVRSLISCLWCLCYQVSAKPHCGVSSFVGRRGCWCLMHWYP